MGRVAVDTAVEVDPADPIFSLYEQVKVRLHDGRALDSGEIRYARGHAKMPVSPGDLRDKFLDCLDHGGAMMSAERLFAALRDLPNLKVLPTDLFEGIPPPGQVHSTDMARTA
jgi:hypothetical protein